MRRRRAARETIPDIIRHFGQFAQNADVVRLAPSSHCGVGIKPFRACRRDRR